MTRPPLVPSDLNLAVERRARRERILIAAAIFVLVAIAIILVGERL